MVDLKDLLEDPASASVTELTENLSWISYYATQVNDSIRLGVILDLIGISPQTPAELRLYQEYLKAGKPDTIPEIDEKTLTKILNFEQYELMFPENEPKEPLRLPEYTADPLVHESALDAWLDLFYRANKGENPIDTSNAPYDEKKDLYKEIIARAGEKPENLRKDPEDNNPRRR